MLTCFGVKSLKQKRQLTPRAMDEIGYSLCEAQKTWKRVEQGISWNFTKVKLGRIRGVATGATPPPPADKYTKLSWCKGDMRIKDNLRA